VFKQAPDAGTTAARAEAAAHMAAERAVAAVHVVMEVSMHV
jgi:hypothetical protein